MCNRTQCDAVIPFAQPIRGHDGQLMHDVLVPKNTTIIVGIRGANMNKAVWGPDASEWKPERWLNPLPETVTKAKMPGVYPNL